MYAGIIIRLADRDLLLYRENDTLYLSKPDRSAGGIILRNCSEAYDAAAGTDGSVLIVAGNGYDVFLYTYQGDEISAEKLELPEGSSNFRLQLVGTVASLAFTAPIGGGKLGLYHVLPQTGSPPELIDRCALSQRPFSCTLDEYGNIVFVYATHDACVNTATFNWGKKALEAPSALASHKSMTASPHVVMDGDCMHCVYIAKDGERNGIMYYNDFTKATEVVYSGCYHAALPVLARLKEKIYIMWNQYGCAMVADTAKKLIREAEDKRYLTEPSYLGIRLPRQLEDYSCSEIFARDTQEGFRPLIAAEILDEDLSDLLKPRIMRMGEEVEKMYMKNEFTQMGDSVVLGLPYLVSEPKLPVDIELKKLGIRLKMLEDDVKSTVSKVEGILREYKKENKQEDKPYPKGAIRRKGKIRPFLKKFRQK